MNPMLRWASAIHDVKTTQGEDKMQRKRDAQRVKLRQEKEMRRLDAIERENKRRMNQEGTVERDGGEEPRNEESAACKFQKELCWCIHQLELGLINVKPNAQQAQEAERLLKILKSSKAPMARKRQIMRASFGNYRAKMQQEEKKHSEAMKKKKTLTPVESEKQSAATFFRRATASTSTSSPRSPSSRFVNVQPVILETDHEETEEEKEDQLTNREEDEVGGEEDVLMRSLELETMDMHLCKSDDTNRGVDVEDYQKDSADKNKHGVDDDGNMSNKLRWMSKEEEEEEDNEKENIPSRTSTEDDDTNQSQISSNFSSSASLFSFNFEIKEEDMDMMVASRSSATMTTNILKSEGLETHLLRGMDNRASDSTSSSGGTPTKKGGRKRSRGRKKQNQDNLGSGSRPSPKEALLVGSPKIEMAANEGFKFDFPDPVETGGV